MFFNYSKLNIKNENELWLCPSCGFKGYFDGTSFDSKGPLVGTGICPCCLYEPGFDDVSDGSGVNADNPLDGLKIYSRDWQKTFLWQGDPNRIPKGWDGKTQFEELKKLAPSELFND